MPERAVVVRKGFRPQIDSYSAFFENDHSTSTGLEATLRRLGVTRVFLVGLAFDFCVRFSAEDAAKCGFQSVVVKDACRSVGMPGTVQAADEGMAAAGVRVMESGDIAAHVAAAPS